MYQPQGVWEKLNVSSLSYKIGSLEFAPSYLQAGAIIFLSFLLILTLARLRHIYIHWSLGKTSMSMIFWGFLLAVVVEGFLLIGGRTLFTEILGWKSAPKPISNLLDIGRKKVVSVLGVTDEIPTSSAEMKPSLEELTNQYKSLTKDEARRFRENICSP